jgi:EmrB/QacA subfamily drug resistance transporter
MEQPRAHRHAPDGLILAIACVAQFMVVLDVSIVNVALPTIERDLGFTYSGIQWVLNAYVLAFAGFLLLGGRAADFFGRRLVYLTGISLFTVASIGAGLATTETQLIVARAAQGLGGAILSPATLTIIVTTFAGPRLPKAIGAWSAVAGAGGAAGTLLGGMLTGWLSWRWIFFINVPIGLAVGVVALLFLQELRTQTGASKLDLVGSVLVTAALTAVVYGVVNVSVLDHGVERGWGSPLVLGWIGAGLVLLVGFVTWELKVATRPLVPFSIFKHRSLTGADTVMILIGGAFFAMWYFLTFYLQGVLQFSALKAGFAFVPMAIAIIAGAQISSRLIHHHGVRNLVLVGTVLATLGFLALSRISASSSYFPEVIGPGALCAFAMGILFTPLAMAATAGVDRSQSGLASGILNTSRQVGGSLGLAVLATLAASASTAWAGLHSSEMRTLAGKATAATVGFDRAFLVSAGITAAAFLASFLIPATTREQHVAGAPPTPVIPE